MASEDLGGGVFFQHKAVDCQVQRRIEGLFVLEHGENDDPGRHLLRPQER